MTYETAKKLKDAGYPQDGANLYAVRYHLTDNGNMEYLMGGLALRNTPYDEGKMVMVPDLSSLIRSCGDALVSINRESLPLRFGGWYCHSDIGHATRAGDSTPEEAVADLWINLNKHDVE